MSNAKCNRCCTHCGAPCRFVLCTDCYAKTLRHPLPAPQQTDSSLLWLRATAEGPQS